MTESQHASMKRDMEIVLNNSSEVIEPPSKIQKRQDYLSWDDYFMSVAFLSSMRSKDPSTQVGACIVNEEKKIVGIGYNGFPNGCDDDELPWARQGKSPLDTKYPYVCHAEMNAILNKNSTSVKGCTIYVALFPCNECAKLIIQSGITRVIYYSDKYKEEWTFVASRHLLSMAKVACIQHESKTSSVVIDFASMHGTKNDKKHRLREAKENYVGKCRGCNEPSNLACHGCSEPGECVVFCAPHLSDCYLDHL